MELSWSIKGKVIDREQSSSPLRQLNCFVSRRALSLPTGVRARSLVSYNSFDALVMMRKVLGTCWRRRLQADVTSRDMHDSFLGIVR